MTTETRTSNEKISEALELLNEAAREKGDELKHLMANRYAHFQEAIAHTKDFAQDAIVQGQKKAKEIASDVDRRVHKDPWVYIAGTAVTALLLGYFMGSKRK